MTDLPDIDVVIPTWNGCELLERCLVTLDAQTVPHNVIVADNGSTDGTIEMLERDHPRVALVRFDRNRGFAAAVNHGIDAGSAPFVVLVNNDVECDPGFVEQIVAPLRTSPEVGMVAGLLLVPGRSRVDSFGIEIDRTLAAFPRFGGAGYPCPLDVADLAGPSGGAAAYRRSALEQVGSFDARLFAYMEDVDLALRLRAAGWSCAGARDAIGVHLGSATIGRRSRAQVEIAGASRAYMLRRYGVLRSGLRNAAQTLAVELGVIAAETLAARDLAAARGRWRGWRTAADTGRAELPTTAINPSIGLREALRRRRSATSSDRRQ